MALNETLKKSIYGKIMAVPTQDAVLGIKFDFNNGIRVQLPNTLKPKYRIVFQDMLTKSILFDAVALPNTIISSSKKYFIKFKLSIYNSLNNTLLFLHVYDAKDKLVMIQMPVGTLGDSIGWFSYLERFQKKHGCKLIVAMTEKISELFKKQYPEFTFIKKEETDTYKPYASYYMGLFFKGDTNNQPVDFRYAGLHRTISYILDVSPLDIPPRVDLSAPRKIKEKYVCIAVKASGYAKFWNNPKGWLDVIKFLKDNGYRVLCVDKDQVYGQGIAWNLIPNGALDFTGDLPLQERIDLIKDADFFIGLSSGLSWLAWCCNVPVVLISGFTNPTNLFYTPYRIINYNVCNSCWNDMRCLFLHNDFLWCPRHKGTNREYECSRFIASEHVIETIKTIPTFKSIEHKD